MVRGCSRCSSRCWYGDDADDERRTGFSCAWSCWTKRDDVRGKTPNHTNHIVHFSSSHIGGVVFLLCDGSTHFVRDTIEYSLFKALGTRAGGEVASL